MTEPDGLAALPDDWRSREDGLELVLAALLSAYQADDLPQLLGFIDVGHEVSYHGVDFMAVTIAQAVAQKLLGTGLKDLSPENLMSLDVLAALMAQLEGTAPDSELYGSLLVLYADILRRANQNETAVATLHNAIELFDRLARTDRAAVARQSLGATYVHLGDLDRAEEFSTQAEALFEELGNKTGLAEIRLNQVDYALARDELGRAAELLAALEPLLRDLRDGHLSASWLEHSAMVDIHRGDDESARQKLLRALRSCRRRGDLDLQLVVLRNLAKLTRDNSGASKTTIRWGREALDLAKEINDPDSEQSVARSLAVDLIDLGQLDEAVSLLGQATELNLKLNSPLEAAQSQADLGAALLEKAFVLSSASNDASGGNRSAQLNQAVTTLIAAFEQLDQLEDYDWASRTAQNLQIAWTALERPNDGAEYLAQHAHQSSAGPAEYVAALLRIAGHLGLAAQRDDSWALERLKESAERSDTSEIDRAWQLVTDARRANHSFRNHEVALELYDLALAKLRNSDDQVGYANALNDSALIATDLDHVEDARIRLLEVESLASESENRVLAAMAKGNLGELALRQDQFESGRTYLAAAAQLAVEVGDAEQASTAWSSIANSFVDESDGLEAARAAAGQAVQLAEQAKSDDATARSLSALASISYAEGDYLQAHDLWIRASQSRADDANYLGFALDALARTGDWRRYSQELDRLARRAQRSKTQLAFAETLPKSAVTWLRTQSARRASKPLAYAILLGAEGYTTRDSNLFDEDQVANNLAALIATASIFAATQTLLEFDEIPAVLRDQLRHHVTARMTKMVGADDTALLMDQIAKISEWGLGDPD